MIQGTSRSSYCCYIVFFLQLILIETFSIPFRDKDLSITAKKALKFIDEFMEPKDCANTEYMIVNIGCGGGFAAHFQLAAGDWIRAAASYNYSVPVLIVGRIYGYTEGFECSHDKFDWTCLFQPMSSCQNEMLNSGKLVQSKNVQEESNLIPHEFLHKGLAFWYGIVQYRMFRFQERISQYIMNQARMMNSNIGFPFELPIAGIHVRHGDKKSDGFKEHEFESELNKVKESPDCYLVNDMCYIKPINQELPKDELPIFVASDDPIVLHVAASRGHLIDTSGISQQTGTIGMVNHLKKNPEKGFNASLEIIADIFFLSRCSTLIGIAASQIFRMSVGISNATGILKFTSVMDSDQIPKIKALSIKYGVMFPENFT